MRISGYWLRRHVVVCVMVCLAAPFVRAATAHPPQQPQAMRSVPTPSQNPNDANSQSPANAIQAASSPDASSAAQSQANDKNPQFGAGQSSPKQQQNSVPPPVGTAAAPYEKTLGIPASRPAGAVIAPAKQRRTRSFLIRVGVILAAAGAVGIVVGLSKASPSRPQ